MAFRKLTKLGKKNIAIVFTSVENESQIHRQKPLNHISISSTSIKKKSYEMLTDGHHQPPIQIAHSHTRLVFAIHQLQCAPHANSPHMNVYTNFEAARIQFIFDTEPFQKVSLVCARGHVKEVGCVGASENEFGIIDSVRVQRYHKINRNWPPFFHRFFHRAELYLGRQPNLIIVPLGWTIMAELSHLYNSKS